jgi:hypothetical protein
MAASVAPHSGRTPSARKLASEWLLLLGLGALFVVAWAISEALPKVPGSSLDYYLGIVGGSMMLALFLYPLRKRIRFLRSAGPVRFWFASHMALGIGGPLIVLVHTRFQAQSLNAAVALASMLVVMLSGVVGRFIYMRIHHGLYGERATLQQMQGFLRVGSTSMHSKLVFAPEAERQLARFEQSALATRKGLVGSVWSLVTLWLHRRLAFRRCRYAVALALAQIGALRGWPPEESRRRRRAVSQTLDAYMRNVQRVAHFSVWERLFSLWHVVHVPFVYMMVASAVAHVVAVHMY